MKSFLLVICLLVGGSVAIDFTTIGQQEIVDYIKNRADLIVGKKLRERNLQDLLSNAVFTGLEEEALTFAYGTNTDNSDPIGDQLPAGLAVLAASADSPDSVPLQIILTTDTIGSTNIALAGLTTSKSSSSKSSVGDFVVNCVQESSFDSTSLDGSITINLGGTTDSHNLTLAKTIYLAAEVNVTSLGPNWTPSSSSQLTDEGKLLSMLSSKEGSLYVVTYQSLIRETIKAHEGDLFGGRKSSGKVLIVVGPGGALSLSGRTISGKVEATWSDAAEGHVDTFLTLNGSKSRKYVMGEMPKTVSKDLVENWVRSSLHKKLLSNTIHYGRHDYGSRGNRHRGSHGEGPRSGHWPRHDAHRGNRNGHQSDWKVSCFDGSSWPSWKSFWEFGFGHRFGLDFWEPLEDLFDWDLDFDETWDLGEHPPKPNPPRKPVKITEKPKPVTPTTTPKPVKIVKPVTPPPKSEPEIIPTVSTVHQETTKSNEEATTIACECPTTPKPEDTPDLSEPELPKLPRGTTVSLWSTRIM